MKRFLSLIPLLLALFLPCAAGAEEDRLAKLQQSFLTRFDALNEGRDSDLAKLSTGYAGALEKLQEKVQRSGKIEDVIPVRDELESVRMKTDPLPELGANAPGELKQLREKYLVSTGKVRSAHAKELVAITDKMNALLDQESAALTKAGKISDALAAKTMVKSIGEMPEIRAARERVKGDSPAAPEAAGTPLLKGKWTILQQSGYYIGPGDGKVGEGAYSEELRARVMAEPGEGKNHFVATAPSRIEFRFTRPVVAFETELFMAGAGDVICHLLVDDKSVSKSAVSAADRPRRKWKVTVPPSQRIVIDIDENGGKTSDWLVLLAPTVTFADR